MEEGTPRVRGVKAGRKYSCRGSKERSAFLQRLRRVGMKGEFWKHRLELQDRLLSEGSSRADANYQSWSLSFQYWEPRLLEAEARLRDRRELEDGDVPEGKDAAIREAVDADRVYLRGPREQWDDGVVMRLCERLSAQERNPSHTQLWNMQWVAENLYNDSLRPDDVPNMTAFNFLIHARQRPQDFYQKFFQGVKDTKSYEEKREEEASSEEAQAAAEERRRELDAAMQQLKDIFS